ncbi:hypothetical protein Tco_1183199 [Tanacetum coccineum]
MLASTVSCQQIKHASLSLLTATIGHQCSPARCDTSVGDVPRLENVPQALPRVTRCYEEVLSGSLYVSLCATECLIQLQSLAVYRPLLSLRDARVEMAVSDLRIRLEASDVFRTSESPSSRK